MNLKILEAKVADIPLLQELAARSWWTAYCNILSNEQMAYMLEKMYAAEVLSGQMNSGKYPYFLALWENMPVGFLGLEFHSADRVLKLQKIYLVQEARGRGIGEKLLDFAERQANNLGYPTLTLNVNKQNPALVFYQKHGYRLVAEGVFDIGNGFVMDDFILEKTLPYINLS